MPKLFFALDLQPATKNLIAQMSLKNALVGQALLKHKSPKANNTSVTNNKVDQCIQTSVKKVDKENYHITLCFLGNVTYEAQNLFVLQVNQWAENAFNDLLLDKKDLSLTFNHYGLFKKPQVFYMANNVIPTWQKRLAESLANCARSLHIFQEERAYLSHISLYRKVKLLPSNLPALDLKISIKGFSLYQSVSSEDGVRYLPIQTWSF